MAGAKFAKFPVAGVKKVICVASGKGGVGKSSTAGMLTFLHDRWLIIHLFILPFYSESGFGHIRQEPRK